MNENRALMERAYRLFPEPEDPFESLRRRRDRKRRNQRVSAVVFTLLLLAVAIGGAIVLLRSSEHPVPANPPGAADWSQFGSGPGRTFSNPAETTLTTENVAGLHVAWSTDLGRDVDTSPVVVDGIVYVGSNHKNEAGLAAVDVSTGEILWSVETLPPPVTSPAVADGTVLVGTGIGVSAFDATTGAELWSKPGPTGTEMTFPPAVAEAIVYVASSPRGIAALDPSTGEEIWGDEDLSMGAAWPYMGGGIAVADGSVFVGGAQHLFAIDASIGSTLWKRWHRYAIGMPLVADGVVYAIFHNYLVALDTSTGAELWSAGPDSSNLVFEHEVVFGHLHGFSSNLIVALDAFTGAELWSRRPASGEHAASMAAANGVLYVYHVAWPGRRWRVGIEALDPSAGEILWTSRMGTWIPGRRPYETPPPAISDGVVYVGGSGTHELFAFHL